MVIRRRTFIIINIKVKILEEIENMKIINNNCEFLKKLKYFGEVKEIEVHKHVPEEKAEYFTSVDAASTEYETLNFLNALIYYCKPMNVIETGTFHGFGTIAIAEALKKNGFGKLYSIEYEKRYIDIAKKNVELYDPDLLNYIEFVLSDSRDWIKNCSIKFDFGFFDSELKYRHVEYKLMEEKNLFNKNFVAMFHDTSRYRPDLMPNNSSIEMIEELDKLSKGKEWFEGIYSRGFRLLKP